MRPVDAMSHVTTRLGAPQATVSARKHRNDESRDAQSWAVQRFDARTVVPGANRKRGRFGVLAIVAWRGNVQRFRGGLAFKAHRRLYHSTLGSRVIKKKKEEGRTWLVVGPQPVPRATSGAP